MLIKKLQKQQDLLLVIGAEKVPRYVYEYADANIAIGNQPHSEVAALAIFLDRYTNGAWMTKQFHGNIQIIPSERGKQVISKEKQQEVKQ